MHLALLAWFASLRLELAYRLKMWTGQCWVHSLYPEESCSELGGFVLIRARAGSESEQYGLFEEASASLVYVQMLV